MTRRALWISADSHSIDGDSRSNPPELFDQPLPDLFKQMLRIVCGRGVVILDSSAAELMTLPTGKLPIGVDAKNHGAAAQLRMAGFTLKEIGRWFHVKHGDVTGPGVWFGLEEFLDPDFFPMLCWSPAVTTAALAEWDRITGHVWQGSAGDAGNAILKAQKYRYRGKQQGAEWWSWAGPEGEPIELALLTSGWRRRVTAPEIYGYDRVRAYLSAMTCTPVAAEGLKHTKLTKYAKGQAGWYLVQLGPWEFESVFPSPAGYSYDDMTKPVWLTHPTVALLEQVAAEGFITFEILDSWTAPATAIMSSYGAALREAWNATRGIDNPDVKKAVRAGIKGAYRIGHGYWRSKQSRVQRPDWAAAVTAMSRSNLWRRIWAVWENGGDFLGSMPVYVDNDNVWYEQEISPGGWTIWDSKREDLDDVTELGHWRTGGVRRRKVSRETEKTA